MLGSYELLVSAILSSEWRWGVRSFLICDDNVYQAADIWRRTAQPAAYLEARRPSGRSSSVTQKLIPSVGRHVGDD